jgi:hypothetical protein
MSSMICPVCRTEYAGWAQRCSTCGVALVNLGERIDVLGLPEDKQVVYELVEWSLDQRSMLGQLLAEQEIPHAWEDTDLIVADVDEVRVDAFCAEIEGDDDDEGVDDLDGEVSEITYDLSEWTDEQRAQLRDSLKESGVPVAWEEHVLVVVPELETAVDAAVDAIVPPEVLPEAPFEVLSDLFVAADLLQSSAEDERGLKRLGAVIDTADSSGPPFGVDAEVWDAIVDAADDLADLLADGASGEDVEAQAAQLRTLLRPYV